MANIKLTPALKHLLTLRVPSVLPSPSLPQLNRVFQKTYQDAQIKRAETGWLVATTCALLTANRPSAVGHLYRFVTRSTLEPDATKVKPLDVPAAINKAALMRESALKSVIFIGVPRVILTLAALHEALDEPVKESLRTISRRSAQPDNIEATVKRGKALWDSIYVPHADKLHNKLGSYHPDFITFIIQCYGSVLSPLPGQTKSFTENSDKGDLDQGNLSRALGSVVGIASLRAEGGVGPQLISHVFGLLKARVEENMSEEDKWLSSDEGTEWIIKTVDEVLDGVSAEDGIQHPARLTAPAKSAWWIAWLMIDEKRRGDQKSRGTDSTRSLGEDTGRRRRTNTLTKKFCVLDPGRVTSESHTPQNACSVAVVFQLSS